MLLEKHKTKVAFWNTRVEEISCAESFAIEGYQTLIKTQNKDSNSSTQTAQGFLSKSNHYNLSKAKALNKELDRILDSGLNKGSHDTSDNSHIESLLETFGIKVPKPKDYFSKRENLKISHSTPIFSQKIQKLENNESGKLFKYPLEEMQKDQSCFPKRVDMPLMIQFPSKSPSEPDIFGAKHYQILRPHEVDALKKNIKLKDGHKLFDLKPKNLTPRLAPIKKMQRTQKNHRDSSLQLKTEGGETYPSFQVVNRPYGLISSSEKNSFIKTKNGFK